MTWKLLLTGKAGAVLSPLGLQSSGLHGIACVSQGLFDGFFSFQDLLGWIIFTSLLVLLDLALSSVVCRVCKTHHIYIGFLCELCSLPSITLKLIYPTSNQTWLLAVRNNC